jgi:uncharacterized membrane protein
MSALFAISYPSPDDARSALDRLTSLQRGRLISITDAVIATRGPDGSVKLDQSVNMTAVGAASGAFWGSLIGLLFLSPLVGAAVGAAAGAAGGYWSDFGISDEFMRDFGAKTPGARAVLFVLAGDISADKIAAAIGSADADVVYTSMSDDVEARFRSRFGVAADSAKAA